MREYAGDGLKNDDWYGYGEPVLAPCDCTVAGIQINPVENEPGILGEPPATWVKFERSDGTSILIAHVKGLLVEEGDSVSAGDVFAVVGNNGYARQPHVHIGAWRGEASLQIRFDQIAMAPEDELEPEE